MDMKRISSRISLGSAALLLALAGTATRAQPAEGPVARGDGPRKAWAQQAGAAGERGGRLMRALDLSAEQRMQIEGIRQRARSEGEGGREQMQALREEIQAGIDAGGYNETQVRVQIESRSQLLVDSMLRRVRTQAEIAAVLTPEQRAKMAELREQRSGAGQRGQRGQRKGG